MLRLLRVFFEIAVWRSGPQDVPASRALALTVLIAYAAMDLWRLRLLTTDTQTLLVLVACDIVMLAVWLWCVLAFFERRERFLQTFIAVLGVGILMLALTGAVDVVQRMLGGASDQASSLLLHLIIPALVVGRILMQALDRGLLTGMGLTIAIIYSTGAIAQLTLGGLRG